MKQDALDFPDVVRALAPRARDRRSPRPAEATRARSAPPTARTTPPATLLPDRAARTRTAPPRAATSRARRAARSSSSASGSAGRRPAGTAWSSTCAARASRPRTPRPRASSRGVRTATATTTASAAGSCSRSASPSGQIAGFGGRAHGRRHAEVPELARVARLQEEPHAVRAAARRSTRSASSGRVIVVEGYFDLLALHRAGLHEVRRAVRDRAHRRTTRTACAATPRKSCCCSTATRRARRRPSARCPILLAEGIRVRAAFLPLGEDPDTLAREVGRARAARLRRQRRPAPRSPDRAGAEGCRRATPGRRPTPPAAWRPICARSPTRSSARRTSGSSRASSRSRRARSTKRCARTRSASAPRARRRGRAAPAADLERDPARGARARRGARGAPRSPSVVRGARLRLDRHRVRAASSSRACSTPRASTAAARWRSSSPPTRERSPPSNMRLLLRLCAEPGARGGERRGAQHLRLHREARDRGALTRAKRELEERRESCTDAAATATSSTKRLQRIVTRRHDLREAGAAGLTFFSHVLAKEFPPNGANQDSQDPLVEAQLAGCTARAADRTEERAARKPEPSRARTARTANASDVRRTTVSRTATSRASGSSCASRRSSASSRASDLLKVLPDHLLAVPERLEEVLELFRRHSVAVRSWQAPVMMRKPETRRRPSAPRGVRGLPLERSRARVPARDGRRLAAHARGRGRDRQAHRGRRERGAGRDPEVADRGREAARASATRSAAASAK